MKKLFVLLAALSLSVGAAAQRFGSISEHTSLEINDWFEVNPLSYIYVGLKGPASLKDDQFAPYPSFGRSPEFGFNLGPERSDKVRSRLAFYADWGMYPLHLSLVGWPTEQPHPVSTKVGDPNDYATYELTHYNSLAETTTMPGKFNQHFQVGLKFTLVLGK